MSTELPPTSQGSPLAGRVLGGFRLVERVGSGGMGEIWRAENAKVSRMVRAVKVIRPELAAIAEFRDRFLMEAEYLDELQHPNILRVENIGEEDGSLYMVMELLSGAGADQLVGRLTVEEACRIIHDAALGLSHAHQRNIIHRDLKPANLFITTAGEVRVLDFGIARHGGGASGLTATGRMQPGTPAYYAPELARGKASSATSDVYALVITLFELLAGRPPFVPDPGVTNNQAVLFFMHQHTTTPIPDVRELRPEVPAELWAVIEAGTIKDPAERLPDAATLAAQLAPFIADHLSLAEMGLQIEARPSAPPRPLAATAASMRMPAKPQAALSRRGSQAGVPAITDSVLEPSRAGKLPAGALRSNSIPRMPGREAAPGRASRLRPLEEPGANPSAPRLTDQLLDPGAGTADTYEIRPADYATSPNPSEAPPPADERPPETTAQSGRSKLVLGIGASAAIVLALGGAWALHASSKPEEAVHPTSTEPTSITRPDTSSLPSTSAPTPVEAPTKSHPSHPSGSSRRVSATGDAKEHPEEAASEAAVAPDQSGECSTPADCVEDCEKHHKARACATMAELYSVGAPHLPASPDLAAEYFGKACALGSAEACRQASGSHSGHGKASSARHEAASCLKDCQHDLLQCQQLARTALSGCSQSCMSDVNKMVACQTSCLSNDQATKDGCNTSDESCTERCGP